MTDQSVVRPAAPWPAPWRAVAGEAALSWRFIRNDPWAGLCPGVAFTVAVAWHHRLAPDRFAWTVAGSVLYFYLYLYGFCLTNQLTGRLEDRINKPTRPLPQGHAGTRGTVVRAGVVFVAFPLVGALLGVWVWALAWEAVTVLNNLAGGARRWLVKDAVIGSGVLLMLAPAWQMAAPLTADTWRWMLTLAVVIFLLIPVQDLRDVPGDTAAGRVTFPIAFGEPFTRAFLAVGFSLLPLVDHFMLLRASTATAWIAEAATAALCVTIAWRVTRGRSPAHDHLTYRLFEYWYAAILAAAIITL
ncbi:UbiA family prenyltransferase [Streptomyces humi]|uniref:UbiA family prenyltransferase n=1 Tax=Streptomyces humi TaxID=1428620 RepID=UPI00069BE364|nr:UbiA family prenyltransferase [Streptomyces humi]